MPHSLSRAVAAVLQAAAALTMVLAVTGLAQATPITRTYEFEATGLQNQVFDPSIFPPTDPVFGFVRVTFDPMGPNILNQRAAAGSVNVQVISPIGFNYDAMLDILTIGGLSFGVDGADFGDFNLRIGDASSDMPEFLRLSYNTRREFWIADRGSVSLQAVPEPGSLTLLALGILFLSHQCRRSRKPRPSDGRSARRNIFTVFPSIAVPEPV